MNKRWKIFNQIILGYLILICFLGVFYKHISFGWGLGDIFGYTILIGVTILHSVLTFSLRKKSQITHIILSIIVLIFAIGISLQATLWRGGEYSWNGSLFYLPCPSKIKIQDDKTEKELLIRMCTMEYYSKFTGIWNGRELEQIEGELKIPEKLKPYIELPVKKVFLKSATFYQTEVNDKLEKKPYFKLDTLEVNKEYSFSGEIGEIIDKQPMFIVK